MCIPTGPHRTGQVEPITNWRTPAPKNPLSNALVATITSSTIWTLKNQRTLVIMQTLLCCKEPSHNYHQPGIIILITMSARSLLPRTLSLARTMEFSNYPNRSTTPEPSQASTKKPRLKSQEVRATKDTTRQRAYPRLLPEVNCHIDLAISH